MFGAFKRRKRQKERGEALYHACVAQARTPEFYAGLGVPDTPDGRFEMIALHTGLLFRRLSAEGETGKGVAQDVFDAMFRDFDSALRDMAVGDTSVGKQIKAMAEAFYGRMRAYKAGLDAGDAAALAEPLARNLLSEGAPDGAANALGAYALAARDRLAAQEGETLMFTSMPDFPPPPVRPDA